MTDHNENRSHRFALFRRIPVGLLVALMVIGLVEFMIESSSLDILNEFQWNWMITSQAVFEADAAGSEVLCFGDSQLKLALAPQIIEQRLGKSAYNFSLVGGQASASYFLLRRVIDQGHKPEMILVNYFPQFLRSSPRDAIELSPHLTNLSESLDLGLSTGNPELLGAFVTRTLLPVARNRLNLRAMTVSCLTGDDPSRRYNKGFFHRNWRVNRGGQMMPPTFDSSDYDFNQWRALNYPDTQFHFIALSYVDRFLKLAGEHEIPVYWVITPVSSGLGEECRRSGFDEDYSRFMKAILKRYSHVVILDSRTVDYPESAFFDPHHLAIDGAVAFTEAVCAILMSHAETRHQTTRHYYISEYQPERIPAEIEDTNTSQRIAISNLRERIVR